MSVVWSAVASPSSSYVAWIISWALWSLLAFLSITCKVVWYVPMMFNLRQLVTWSIFDFLFCGPIIFCSTNIPVATVTLRRIHCWPSFLLLQYVQHTINGYYKLLALALLWLWHSLPRFCLRLPSLAHPASQLCPLPQLQLPMKPVHLQVWTVQFPHLPMMRLSLLVPDMPPSLLNSYPTFTAVSSWP